VTVVTPERARRAALSSTDVAALLGLSTRTLLRIPKEQLDYWLTPGGGVRRHRRYLWADVAAYAREYLGLELSPPTE
jgi:hypothetical protein